MVVIAVINGAAKQSSIPLKETNESESVASIDSGFSAVIMAQDSSLGPIADAENTVVDSLITSPVKEIDTEPEKEVPALPLDEPIENSAEDYSNLSQDSTNLIDFSTGSGFITVQCSPSCSVRVGNESKGQAPPALTMSLATGNHSLVLQNPDFPHYKRDIEVEDGKHDTLMVSLVCYSWDA